MKMFPLIRGSRSLLTPNKQTNKRVLVSADPYAIYYCTQSICATARSCPARRWRPGSGPAETYDRPRRRRLSIFILIGLPDAPVYPSSDRPPSALHRGAPSDKLITRCQAALRSILSSAPLCGSLSFSSVVSQLLSAAGETVQVNEAN